LEVVVVRAQEAVETVLGMARSDFSVVIADEMSEVHLRWANNSMTTNGVTRRSLITVIAAMGGGASRRVGVSSGSMTDRDSLEALTRAAEQAASSAPVQDDCDPFACAQGSAPNWDAPPELVSPDAFSTVVPALASAFGRAERERRLLYGYAEQRSQSAYVATSNGASLRHDQLSGSVQITARALDDTSSAWVGVPFRDPSEICVAQLEGELRRRAAWSRRRLELPPGRYETLLPPAAVADLMIWLYLSSAARDAAEGRSVFSSAGGGTRVDERLTDVPVSLYSDPAEGGLECAPFVIVRASTNASSVLDNGFPLHRTTWIEDGVLRALVQSRQSARCTGMPVTPEIDNLILEGPGRARTLEQMVADTESGLLLTSLWYLRELDPRTLLLTGVTRDGVFLVEGGEIVGAVNNFRFNESPVDILSRLIEVGASSATLAREWGDSFPRTRMPSLRIADFNMSSASQAS
jgi:predicted Zn-dependent protease